MSLKLKIPPAVVTAVCIGLMWLLDFFAPIGFTPLPGAKLLATAFLGVSVFFGLSGLYQFYHHRTSIDPHRLNKASSLVTGGVYRISRNPMYVALFFLLIACAILLQNIVNLLVLPLFVWYMNRFQIIPEEEVMEEKFGDAYRNYKSEVRRWF